MPTTNDLPPDGRHNDVRGKVIFLVALVFVAVTLSAIASVGAVAICHLAGVAGIGLVMAFGSTAATVFGGVIGLGGIAAKLFFP
jgi:hypothetical protein